MFGKIKRFLKTVWSWYRNNFCLVSWETFFRRASACNGCPYRKKLNCGICGCFLPAKMIMECDEVKCPEFEINGNDRWAEVTNGV